jgi:probable HAF family extracellular repeat protein
MQHHLKLMSFALVVVSACAEQGTVSDQGLTAVAATNAAVAGDPAAYRWVPLPTLPGQSGEANDINEDNVIVGFSHYHPSLGNSGPQHAALWRDSSITDLGTLGGPSSNAIDINNDGVIVGWA